MLPDKMILFQSMQKFDNAYFLTIKKRADVKLLSHVQLFVTQWTIACQAPPSIGFSRQESWSGLPFPSPGDLPDTETEPGSPALQADSLPSELPGAPFFNNRKVIFQYHNLRQNMQIVFDCTVGLCHFILRHWSKRLDRIID